MQATTEASAGLGGEAIVDGAIDNVASTTSIGLVLAS